MRNFGHILKHGATLEDLKALPEEIAAEIIDGELVEKAAPKLRTLYKHAVPHYWLLDPERRTLTVLRWAEAGYVTVLSAEAGERARAEPFDALELDTAALFEGG